MSKKINVTKQDLSAIRLTEGQLFKTARITAQMTRASMARELGISWHTVDRFEKGMIVQRRKFVKKSYYNELLLRLSQMMLTLAHTESEGDLS